MRMGSFPKPRRGQSLTSFLRSKLFANAELDRENAHFAVSEAIIAAIEQVNYFLNGYWLLFDCLLIIILIGNDILG